MREPFGKARVLITTILVLEVCIGIAIILVTFCYQRILGGYMAEMERKMLTGQFFNTFILGFQLIATFLASIFMWHKIWQYCCSENLKILLGIWAFFCFLIVICGFGTVWSLFTCADSLETSAEMSLLKGIDLYYVCPERKLLWDGLQYHKECCGVHGYKDWSKASWMPKEPEAPSSFGGAEGSGEDQDGGEMCATTHMAIDERKPAVLAPYACCKHACSSCYQNYMPRSISNPIPTLNLSQINPNGCLPYFHKSMWHVLYLLLVLIIAAIVLDLILCGLTKYIVGKQSTQSPSQGRDNMGLQVESSMLFCEPSNSQATTCDANQGYTIKQDVVCPLQRGPRLCSCGQPMAESDSRIIH